jgi:hypothetical protein
MARIEKKSSERKAKKAVYKTVEELQKLYPDSWVLLENPVSNKKNTLFVGGIFHYKHKVRSKVFEKATQLGLQRISVIYTGGKLDDVNFMPFIV